MHKSFMHLHADECLPAYLENFCKLLMLHSHSGGMQDIRRGCCMLLLAICLHNPASGINAGCAEKQKASNYILRSDRLRICCGKVVFPCPHQRAFRCYFQEKCFGMFSYYVTCSLCEWVSHVFIHACTYVIMHTRIHTDTRAHSTKTHRPAHIRHTYIHTYRQTYGHADVHTNVQTYTDVQT